MWIRWHHPTSAMSLTVVPLAAAWGVTRTGTGDLEGCTWKVAKPMMKFGRPLSQITAKRPRPAGMSLVMRYRPVYQRPPLTCSETSHLERPSVSHSWTSLKNPRAEPGRVQPRRSARRVTVVPGRPARGETVTGSDLGRTTCGRVVVVVVVDSGVVPGSSGGAGSSGVPGGCGVGSPGWGWEGSDWVMPAGCDRVSPLSWAWAVPRLRADSTTEIARIRASFDAVMGIAFLSG